MEYLCVQICGKPVLVEAGVVGRVIRGGVIQPLPGGLPFQAGVVVAEGDVIPVVEVSSFLGGGEVPGDAETFLLQVGSSDRPVALRVDGPVDVVDGSDRSQDVSESVSAWRHTDLCEGVVKVNGREYPLLNVHAVLGLARQEVAGVY